MDIDRRKGRSTEKKAALGKSIRCALSRWAESRQDQERNRSAPWSLVGPKQNRKKKNRSWPNVASLWTATLARCFPVAARAREREDARHPISPNKTWAGEVGAQNSTVSGRNSGNTVTWHSCGWVSKLVDRRGPHVPFIFFPLLFIF